MTLSRIPTTSLIISNFVVVLLISFIKKKGKIRDDMTNGRGVNCRYIRSEGVGFLPGQASLAYFFLLGPLDEGSDSTAGGCVNSTLSREVTGAAAGSIGADKSTSGAGLGINGSPNFEAKVDENSPEDAD